MAYVWNLRTSETETGGNVLEPSLGYIASPRPCKTCIVRAFLKERGTFLNASMWECHQSAFSHCDKFLVQSFSKARICFGSQFKGPSVLSAGPVFFGPIAVSALQQGNRKTELARSHYFSSRTYHQGPSFLLLGPTSTSPTPSTPYWGSNF